MMGLAIKRTLVEQKILAIFALKSILRKEESAPDSSDIESILCDSKNKNSPAKERILRKGGSADVSSDSDSSLSAFKL